MKYPENKSEMIQYLNKIVKIYPGLRCRTDDLINKVTALKFAKEDYVFMVKQYRLVVNDWEDHLEVLRLKREERRKSRESYNG